MKPTDTLREEHRVIERGLTALSKAVERLEMGEEVSREILEKAVDFIRGFADRCHHRKEEDILFPYLEGKGLTRDQGPVGVMLAEHDVGRGHVRGMSEAIENAAPQAFVAHARAYLELLGDHIAKEDDVLFPMADQLMTPVEAEELMSEFEGVEEELEEAHHKYLGIVTELEEYLGIE